MDESVESMDAGEEEEEEELTSAEVVARLEEAWRNEKFAPDLLEAKSELVDCTMEQLSAMEANLSRAKAGDLRVAIHRLELDRIRFVLTDYLRCRLKKIEARTEFVISSEARRGDHEAPHLTVEEFEFAKAYLADVKSHLTDTVLLQCPKNLQSVKWGSVMPRPSLDAHVFFRVDEDADDVVLDDQDDVVEDLRRGSQYIARYKLIADLVAERKVSLI